MLRALVVLAGLLAACGAPESDPAGFRVALLTPGSVNDGGWNQGAYQGLERIAVELGAEVSHVQTRTPAEIEEGFRDYAARGYGLVFGHGFEYQEPAARVADAFPDTIFVTTSGNTVRPNVAPMVFELEQATYLCGMLAASLSRGGKLGMIGGQDLPSIRSTFLAFRGGAQAASPDVAVREVFIGNFDDTAAAREAALALIEEGADFLIHQANDAGRGVFAAVSERSSVAAPLYAFGTNLDQSAMAPDVVMASATVDIPGAFLVVARRVQGGTFRAEPMRLGLADGIVGFALNPGLADRIPTEVSEALAASEASIRTGELEVPRGAF